MQCIVALNHLLFALFAFIGVIFLTGSIIERVKEEDMQMKGYFGFEIMHQDLCTG